MTSSHSLLLAFSPGHPLFGNQWLALLAILGGVACFIFAVAGVGRWMGATHPAPPVRIRAVRPAPAGLSPELLLVLCAAVADEFGPGARIASIRPTHIKPPSVEGLMLHWSLEGRRQIYSSHKVR